MPIEGSWTTSQLKSVTRQEVMAAFLRKTGLGVTGTASGGSTTTIDDTSRLLSSQMTTNEWVGGWARIAKNANSVGNAPETQVRAISAFDPATNARVTVDAYTAAVEASDLYELWTNPNPLVVIDLLNEVMTEELKYPCYTVLTEVPDGDMEQSNTTDWGSSNATISKQSNTLFGIRCLRVLATAASAYANTATNIDVEPSRGYHVSAVVRCQDASTTATLLVRDVTNGATIDSKTVSNLYPARVYFDFETPAGCKQITIRLMTNEDTKYTEWDEVCLQPHSFSEIRLPWWAQSREDVVGIYKLEPRGITTNLWEPSLLGTKEQGFEIREGMYGDGQLRAVPRYAISSAFPFFVLGKRTYEAFTDDTTDTRLLDLRLLVLALSVRVFDYFKRPQFKSINQSWLNQKIGVALLEYQEALAAANRRMEDIEQGPSTSVYLRDPRFVFGNL